VTAFRWVVGGFAALMAVCMLISFVIAVVAGNEIWYGRARRCVHWVWLSCLFWFNVEVLGRVGWTLVHWNS